MSIEPGRERSVKSKDRKVTDSRDLCGTYFSIKWDMDRPMGYGIFNVPTA